MIKNTDVCVIGAGSAGLSVAVGAAQMGASTILIEHGKMGGDCLNTGCVPSKSLLAAAKAAYGCEHMSQFGLKEGKVTVDHAAVYKHVHDVMKQISPHDSVERMESLGIEVIHQTAQFINDRDLQVNGMVIRAKRYVIATGSKPIHPDVPGIENIPYFTNETIFDVQRPMEHLLIIGGGPIGMEMAQAHARLGSKVTILQKSGILPRDDQELVEIIRRKFKEEGIQVYEHTDLNAINFKNGIITISGSHKGENFQVQGSHLLVATGRKPNVEHLQLDLAGVVYSQKGILVDEHLRTRNHRIYAIGDVIGQQQFTHAASYHASIVLRNILFRMSAKVDPKVIPWVTYTDPELAHIGMIEEQCASSHMAYRVLRFPMEENDRAQCERQTEGLIKVILDHKDRIIGVTICSHQAGELLPFWILAMSKNLKMKDIASLVIPYPTLSEVHKGISSSYFRPIIFSKKVRWLVRFLMRFAK
jgi:pyruvate/2-oxoglutarate dehydrogenase complex dihydrolipoamide dehydrogenase (E3) component